jgi:hypothetical protein
MIYGVKWPALGELRARFVERHGPQDWLRPDVTDWPVWKPTQTEADVGRATKAETEADAALDALMQAQTDLELVRSAKC